MIVAALLAAAAVKAAPMEVRVPSGATWRIAAEQIHTLDDNGTITSWTLTTERQLTVRKHGLWGTMELAITPISAAASPGAPADVTKRAYPHPVVVQVDHRLSPTLLVDEKGVRKAIEALGVERPSRPWETERQPLAVVSREVALVARMQGFPLVPGKPVEYAPNVVTPLGGFPAKGKGVYLLESYNPDAGRAVLVWRETVDPAAYRESAARLVAFSAKAKRQLPAETAARLAGLEMSSENACRYDVDLPSGLATRVVCDSRFNFVSPSGRTTSSDHWVITQTLPGRP